MGIFLPEIQSFARVGRHRRLQAAASLVALACLAFGCICGGASSPALAEDPAPSAEGVADHDWGRLSVIEENDSIYLGDDRYYTQGAQFSWLSPSVGADSHFYAPFEALSGNGILAPFRAGGQWHRQH